MDDDDDEDDEQEANKKKEGGLSNKKKKLERRMKIAELKQICNRPDVVEVQSSFQSSEPAASSFIFADKNSLRIYHLSSSHIFSPIPGLGCNCCRSKIACISQGIQKYSTCSSALVSKAQVLAGLSLSAHLFILNMGAYIC